MKIDITNEDGTMRSLEELKAEVIRAALDCRPTVTTVARELGIGRTTLYREIAALKVTRV